LPLRRRFPSPRRVVEIDGRRVGAGSVLGVIFLALAFSLIVAFIAAYNARTSSHVLSMERRLQEEALRSRELLRIYLINNTETGALDVVILNAWDRGSEIVYELTVDKSGAVIDEGRVGWSLPPRMTLNVTLTQPDVGDFKVVTVLGNVFASSLPGLFTEGGPSTQSQTTSVGTIVTTTAATTSGGATTTGPRTSYNLLIMVQPPDAGWTSPMGLQSYLPGTVVTCRAFANAGYVFDLWTGTGFSTDTRPEITVVMDRDRTLTAYFRLSQSTTTTTTTSSSTTSEAPVHHRLSVGIDPAELSGSTLHTDVTTPDGQKYSLTGTFLTEYPSGSKIQLKADRQNGYYWFYQWDINDRSFTTISPVVEFVLDEPKTCLAHYTPPPRP